MATSTLEQPKGMYGDVSGLFGPGFDDPGSDGGRGFHDLPNAYKRWSGPARQAVPGVAKYIEGVQPVKDYYKSELGKDYEDIFAQKGRRAVEGQFEDSRRRSSESFTRGGFAGGTVTSPLVAEQLALEDQSRAGAFGLAAQQAVVFAQQMKERAATGLQNIEANILNAWLVPGQMQQSTTARVPISDGGPSTWAQAAQAAAAVGSYLAG